MKQLFFFFSLLTAPFLTLANDYYVSNAGNDSSTGSMAQPWQTIQYGADQLIPGDVLHVMTGVYNEKIVLHVSGNTNSPIIIDGTGYQAVIDGTGLTTENAMIRITNQSYITIRGLEIRNNIMNDAQGILVEGNCSGIRLISNILHDIHFSANPQDTATASTNAQGIIVFGSDPLSPVSDLLIQGNELFDCRLGYSEGVAVNGNVDGFIVEYNEVHDLTNIGIVAIGHEQTCSDPQYDQARNGIMRNNKVYGCRSPYAACAGIYVDGARLIRIEANSCRDNDYGIEVGCEHPGKSADSIIVKNNIIWQNGIAGLALGGYDYPSGSGKVIQCKVNNNTFYKNDTLHDGNGEVWLTYVENTLLENNILYTNDQNRAVTFSDAAATAALNYNLYYVPSGDQSDLIATTTNSYTLSQFQQSGQDASSLYGDPIFNISGTEEGYFQFITVQQINSPAVDHGNPSYQWDFEETDYFGMPRHWGAGFIDIGASELVLESLNEFFKETEVMLIPNPSAGIIRVSGEYNYEKFEVFDLAGRAVLQGSLCNNEADLQTIPSGVYRIRFYGNDRIAGSRLVRL